MFGDPWNSQTNKSIYAPRSSSCKWFLIMVCIFFTGVWVHSLELHQMFQQPTYRQYADKSLTKPIQLQTAEQQTTFAPSSSSSSLPQQNQYQPIDNENFLAKEIEEAKKVAHEHLENLIERAPGRDYRSFDKTMPLIGNEHVLAMKMVDAIRNQREYIIGIVGTSNAACHDTTIDACFPAYFASDMRSLLARVGVQVKLINHGMGGINSIIPSLCQETMIGTDPDVLLYEFLMSDAGLSNAPLTHELLIRQALKWPRQPVTHFVEIEGGRRKEQEVDGVIPPRQPGEDRDDHFGHYYYRPLREHYKEFNVHHMQMLDGLYTIDHLPFWRYENLFATFHPSAIGHRYLADQLSYYHTKAFLMALDLLPFNLVPNKTYKKPLPAPLYCKGRWCDAVPECWTSFQPRRYKDHSIQHAWGLPAAEYLQNATAALEISAETWEKEGKSEWHRVLALGERLEPERNYLDFKLVWTAKKGAAQRSWSFTMKENAVGLILVCEPPPIWGKRAEGHKALDEEGAVEFTLDGLSARPVSHEVLKVIGGLCDAQRNMFSDICYVFGPNIQPGKHTLTLTPNSEHFIVVSHLAII